MVRIILIRHGETVWNREARMQGHKDSPLTEVGCEQAAAAGRRLKEERCTALLHSDLGRTCHTARLIAGASGLDMQPEPQLRERSLGILEGMTKPEIQARYPDIFASYQSRRPDFVIPGGESLQQVFDRTRRCLTRIAELFEGACVAVVTHGGILDAAYRLVTNMALDVPRAFTLENASLNHIVHRREGWQLARWGEVEHLGALTLGD